MKISVVRGALSLGTARIAINILNAASILVLARLLTPDDFGIVAIATALLSVVMSLTEMSLEHALIQRQELTRGHIDTVWTMALIRSVLIVVAFAVLAWPISVIFSDTRLMPVVIVASFGGVLMSFYNPRVWLATKEMRFGPLLTVQLAQKALGLTLAVVLAILFGSYWAIIIGTAVGAAFASAISYLILPYKPRFTMEYARDIWGFSSWMFFGQFFETLNWRFDQLFLGLVLPKAMLGIYSVSDNLAAMPTRETAAPLRQALFPGMSVINEDPERLRGSYLKAQSAIGLLTLPAGIGLALVAAPAVDVILGENWGQAVPFVQLLSLSYACSTLNIGMQPMAMAMGETKLLFWRRLVGLALRIPAVVIGFGIGGLFGAAVGRLISSIIGCFIDFECAQKLSGITILTQTKSHLPTISAAGIMASFVLCVDLFFQLSALDSVVRLVLLALIGGLIYCISVVAIWLAMGRPNGAFSEISSISQKLGKSVFRKKAVSSL